MKQEAKVIPGFVPRWIASKGDYVRFGHFEVRLTEDGKGIEVCHSRGRSLLIEPWVGNRVNILEKP